MVCPTLKTGLKCTESHTKPPRKRAHLSFVVCTQWCRRMTDIITSARVVVSQNALLLRDDDTCVFVYFLLNFLSFSPLPYFLLLSRFDSSERRVTKRRERKMRLLFCGKNFNGAKVILATTTRKTTTTMNLFSRRCCFCSSSSARKCSPRTKIIISKRGGGVCLLYTSPSPRDRG